MNKKWKMCCFQMQLFEFYCFFPKHFQISRFCFLQQEQMGVRDPKAKERLIGMFKTYEQKKQFIQLVNSKKSVSRINSAENYIQRIKNDNGSHVSLQSLSIELKTQNMDWVKSFVELGGTEMLLEELQKCTKTKQADKRKQFDLIACLTSLLNTEIGVNGLLDSKLASGLDIVATCLDKADSKTKIHVLMLLSLLLSFSKKGFSVVHDVLRVCWNYFFFVQNPKSKFFIFDSRIINSLGRKAFINSCLD